MAVGRYSDQELNLIMRHFAVSDSSFDFNPMTSGLINDTFLVLSSNTPLYVLQRINHEVFQNVSGLMDNMCRTLSVLKSEGYTQLNLIKTTTENYFHTSGADAIGHWRLMEFIEDTRTYNTAPNTTIAFEAGRIIGLFHLLLAQTDPDEFVETIARFHDLSYRDQQFQNALKSAESERMALAAPASSFAQETLLLLRSLKAQELPIRVCHNDTKLNNILFSKKTDKAFCLIDLDTLMPGYFLYDFGDAVRTIANTAVEDETNHEKITFDQDRFKAFLEGLARHGQFLTKNERNTLSIGIVLMPFLHGLRALTDYLENDTYYKVSYHNQNLDRAQSLFAFTKKALGAQEDIKALIADILGT